MKVLDITGSPGSRTKPTEDRAGSSGNLGWVIDGATDFTNERTLPGSSNVQWLVDVVDRGLRELGALNKFTKVADVFDRLGETVRAELASVAPSGLRHHPCCSIGLAVFDDGSVELGRIGDAVLVAYAGDLVEQQVSTDFFDRREARAVRQSRSARQTKEEIVAAMFSRRMEYITGVHPESVFSGHPAGVFHVHRHTMPLQLAETVLICTDGFARAVDDYRLFPDWQELGRYARHAGLEGVTRLIRRHEASSAGLPGEKFKSADDVAAILLDSESRR
ncbi:protein phosphatase 2C domain-containing protein [Sphaerisporangium rhizosphaerae]|uniref:Protein phosphatase 2C domain-containing protein n=1 Tax=Sphaerisporangium rhizosphaerae TaxID=2269375 RepID=A0ABW2P0G3_9ACTN